MYAVFKNDWFVSVQNACGSKWKIYAIAIKYLL